jgi:hypothetical protein
MSMQVTYSAHRIFHDLNPLVQSPASQDNEGLASLLLWSPKVHYVVHKNSKSDHILFILNTELLLVYENSVRASHKRGHAVA